MTLKTGMVNPKLNILNGDRHRTNKLDVSASTGNELFF